MVRQPLPSEAALPSIRGLHSPCLASIRAFGALKGCGCSIVVETSSGCLLGASVTGRRELTAEAVAAAAVDELREAVSSGACVDQW